MVSWTEDFFGELGKTGVGDVFIVHGGICGGLRSMVGWILKVVD